MRILVTGKQQIPQVEVTMPPRTRVNIDMNKLRPVVRVRNHETELFHRLAQRGRSRLFARVDVSARL
jgi:hypothetical protein